MWLSSYLVKLIIIIKIFSWLLVSIHEEEEGSLPQSSQESTGVEHKRFSSWKVVWCIETKEGDARWQNDVFPAFWKFQSLIHAALFCRRLRYMIMRNFVRYWYLFRSISVMLFGPKPSPALFSFFTYNFFCEFSGSCFFFFPLCWLLSSLPQTLERQTGECRCL